MSTWLFLYEFVIYTIIWALSSETKLEGHGKTNFPNMPIRNKISGHGKANLINIPKSQNSPKYKQKISKTTPKILKTKNKTQNHHNYAAAAFTESVKFRFKQISWLARVSHDFQPGILIYPGATWIISMQPESQACNLNHKHATWIKSMQPES